VLIESISIFLLLGVFAGLAAGLLGVGGGLIIVPVFAYVFQKQGFGAEIIMHLAIGTSLAAIVFSSLSSVRAHHKHEAILWPVFTMLLPGIIFGALFGALFAKLLSTQFLNSFFAVFELVIAVKMATNFRPTTIRRLPQIKGMITVGGITGAVSSIVGVGGGAMIVPFLVWCNVSMRNAVATSSACGLPLAIAGATGFVISGWRNENLPEYSVGFIYLPALLGVIVTSVLFAPVGANLAHKLPAKLLKNIFAGFLLILGVHMLLK